MTRVTLSRLSRWLAPPTFDNEETTERARLQNVVFWGAMALALLFSLVILLLESDPGLRVLLTGLWILAAAGGLGLMHRGKVDQAGLLFAIFAWLIPTLDAWLAGTVLSAGFTSYAVIIVLIGLLAGLRLALIFAGLSALSGLGLLYVEASGTLAVPPLSTSSTAIWTALTFSFIAVAVLLYLANRSIAHALERARTDQAALRTSNNKLKATRTTLEERSKELATAVEVLEHQLLERQQMADSLRQSEEELRLLNTELERRVQERTGQLAEANEALTQEIATRQQAEVALKETFQMIERAKQEWEATVDALPQIVCLIDRQGRVKRANRTVERWGLAPVTAVKDRPLGDLLHPDCRDPDCKLKSFWNQTAEDLIHGRPAESEINDDELGRYLHCQFQPIITVAADRYQPSDTLGVLVVQDITGRKEAEQQLRESQARLQSILNNAPAVIFIKDPDGRYILMNRQCEALAGVKSDEAKGRTSREIWPPAVAEQFVANERQVMETGGPIYVEESLALEDGVHIYYSNQFPILDNSGQPEAICGISIDITDRKELETALAESEQRYRIISELTSDYAYSVRLEPDGAMTGEWYSEAFKRVSGLEPGPAAHDVGQSIHPEDQLTFQRRLKKLLSGSPAIDEYRIITVAGETRWLRDYARPEWDDGQDRVVRIVGAGQDITDRKEAELEVARYRDRLEDLVNERTAEIRWTNLKLQQEMAKHQKTAAALKQSEENFRALADNAQDGFIIIAGDEKVVYANQRAGQMTGYGPDEVGQLSLKDLVHRDQYETISGRYRRRLAGEKVASQYETIVICKDGRPLPVEITAAKTSWSGQPADVVSLRDITERKRAEESLRQRNQELQTLQAASTTISSSLDLDHILSTVTREMANLLGVESCTFSEWDQESDTVYQITAYAPQAWLEEEPELYHLADYPVTKQVLTEQVPVQMTLSQPDIDPAELAYMQRVKIKTFMMLPMVYQDQAIGLVDIEDSRLELTFTAHQIAIAQALIDQAVVAMQNARLYEQAREEIAERRRAEQELRQSEERFRRVITSISDHIYVTEVTPAGDHLNIYISPNVERLTGYPPERFLANWALWSSEILHPDDRTMAAAQLAELDRGRPSEAEYRLIRRDGDVIWVRDSARVEDREKVKIIYGVINDITARKEAEEVIVRYSERLEILRQIEQGILSAQSVEEIGRAAMSRIRRLIPCHNATITIFDYVANEAVVIIRDIDQFGQERGQLRVKLPQSGRSATAMDRFNMLKQGQITILEEADLRLEYQHVRDRSIRSVMVAPLLYQDELIGSLNLAVAEAGAFTPEHREIAHQVAGQLAIAIRQADLYAQTRQHAVELEKRVTDRTRELSALYEVSSVASELLTLESMLERCLKQVLAALGSNAGLIFLRDEPGQAFVLASQQGMPDQLASQIEALLRERSILDRIIDSGGPVIIPDLRDHLEVVPELVSQSLGSYAGAPVRTAGQLIGILNILASSTRQFNIEELALLSSVADQIGVAVENLRLREQAETAAVMAERERLARELHDSVTQSLYSLTLFTEGSLELAKNGQMEQVQHNLTRIGATAQQALKEMRMMVYELRPPDLEREGLVGALHQRLAAVEKRAGLNARLVAEELVELGPEVEQEIYWIVQEALNNIIKHAGATNVSIHLRVANQKILVEIVDDGRGFDPEAAKTQGGLGLTGIYERARKLGGHVDIYSAPNEGTMIHMEIVG